jgi:hypothetical protein
VTAPPIELDFTEFWPKPIPVRQVQFTGFGDDGNGWDILSYLHDRGIEAYGRGDAIYLTTDDRAEGAAYAGWWLVIGTEGEHYFIRPSVHEAKYTDRGPS